MENSKPDRVQCPQCKNWADPARMVVTKIFRRGYSRHTGKRETHYQLLSFCKNSLCAARYQSGGLGYPREPKKPLSRSLSRKLTPSLNGCTPISRPGRHRSMRLTLSSRSMPECGPTHGASLGGGRFGEARGALLPHRGGWGGEERTKTKYPRTVMLNSRALHALGNAKKIVEARLNHRRRKRQSSPYVFQPSGSSEHIVGPTTPGGHFTKALEALAIKPRSQYNSRHTFATMCLMSGMHPAFIAEQFGHSVEVLLSRYARWLSSTNDWTEVGKLESRIGTKLVRH